MAMLNLCFKKCKKFVFINLLKLLARPVFVPYFFNSKKNVKNPRPTGCVNKRKKEIRNTFPMTICVRTIYVISKLDNTLG